MILFIIYIQNRVYVVYITRGNMKAATMDMTEGSLKKKILVFSLPLILSHLLQVLFNMSDVAVVGRFAGPVALGAVGSTTTLVCLYLGLFIGLGSGVNALTALYIGSKSDKDVKETVHTAFIISLIAGFLIMALGMLLTVPTLRLLNTKEELFDGAKLYLYIYFLGFPATSVYNFGNGVYAAAGDTKKPLTYLTIAGVVNVLLNLFLVIVCNLSVAGVAIASAVSQYISAILVLIALFKEKENFGLCSKNIRLNREKAAKLLRLGVPAGLQNAIFQLANLFIQAGVNSFDAVTVEGNAAAANADGIVYNIMNAFYVACTSFIGQNLGAKKRDRMLKSFYISLAYSFLAGLIPGVLIVAFGRQFLSIFTTDAAVIEAGLSRLVIMGFSYCVSAFMDNTIAASRGIGKTGVPTLIVILGSCVFRVIWVYTIFAHFHTIQSLYLLYVFSWSLTALFELWYFFKSYRALGSQTP